MDFFQLISDIEKVDPEVYQRFDSRRQAFKYLRGVGQKLTAAAVPGFMAAVFNKAYGQGTGTTLPAPVAEVLNLALQLEYLEFYFYSMGLQRNILPSETAALTKIRNDESGHIKVLRGALGSQIAPFLQTDPPMNAFDFTGQNTFRDVETNPATYFAVAQAFVDTGVRAYKGGAPILMLATNRDILQAGLNIHSVEARHSSHIRTVRRGLAANAVGTTVLGDLSNLTARPKSWISGTDNGGSSPNTSPVNTQPVYGPGAAVTVPAMGSVPAASIPSPAENNVIHATINVQERSTAPAGLTISAAAASEAFDEPLDAATVKTIARNFRSSVGATLGLFA